MIRNADPPSAALAVTLHNGLCDAGVLRSILPPPYIL